MMSWLRAQLGSGCRAWVRRHTYLSLCAFRQSTLLLVCATASYRTACVPDAAQWHLHAAPCWWCTGMPSTPLVPATCSLPTSWCIPANAMCWCGGVQY